MRLANLRRHQLECQPVRAVGLNKCSAVDKNVFEIIIFDFFQRIVGVFEILNHAGK